MDLNKITNILLILLIVHYMLKSISVEYILGKEPFAELKGSNKPILPKNIGNRNTNNPSNMDDNLNINNDLEIEEELYNHAVRDTNSVEEFTNNSSLQSNTYLPNGLVNGNKLDNCDEIKPLNHFGSSYNTPNFNSECANTQGYYSLKTDNHAYYYDNKGNKHNIVERNVSNDVDTNWKYKNEIPMNGGAIFASVTGVDVSSGNYATFSNKNTNINSKFYQQEQNRIDTGMANKSIWN
jgi:hypothetical protein